jgi:hypothetical protein
LRRLAEEPILDLHAAAFESSGRAALIAGPKHSGKTTLLCYALASGQARMLANDRVFLAVAGDRVDAVGVPTLMSIRARTAQLFPALDPPHATPLAPGPVVTPQEFAARLSSSCVRDARLAAVVFPEINNACDGWALQALSENEGVTRLQECVYGGARDLSVRTVFEERYGPARPGGDRELTPRLGRGIRFVRCQLGPHAYDASAAEWLRAVLGY